MDAARGGFQEGSLAKAWGRFLEEFQWDHFATLTFGFAKCSTELAMIRLANWANGLSRFTQRAITWVGFPEPTHEDLMHVHALTMGTKYLGTDLMESQWRRHNGLFVFVEEFDEGRGAEYYVTKFVSDGFSEGTFSSNFGRIAKRREPYVGLL